MNLSVTLVGRALPDETQRMRIRMKVVIVGAHSGQLEMLSSEPFEVLGASAFYTRVSSDQAQVATPKDKAYKSTVKDLVKRYSR
jgi:hypothetical protein